MIGSPGSDVFGLGGRPPRMKSGGLGKERFHLGSQTRHLQCNGLAMTRRSGGRDACENHPAQRLGRVRALGNRLNDRQLCRFIENAAAMLPDDPFVVVEELGAVETRPPKSCGGPWREQAFQFRGEGKW